MSPPGRLERLLPAGDWGARVPLCPLPHPRPRVAQRTVVPGDPPRRVGAWTFGWGVGQPHVVPWRRPHSPRPFVLPVSVRPQRQLVFVVPGTPGSKCAAREGVHLRAGSGQPAPPSVGARKREEEGWAVPRGGRRPSSEAAAPQGSEPRAAGQGPGTCAQGAARGAAPQTLSWLTRSRVASPARGRQPLRPVPTGGHFLSAACFLELCSSCRCSTALRPTYRPPSALLCPVPDSP